VWRCGCWRRCSPAREPSVVSGSGSPAHPRAARGPLERPIRSLPDRSPQALVPLYRQLPLAEQCLRIRAILARLSAIPDAPIGGGPIHSCPVHRPETTHQQLRAMPRQATTPGLLTPRSDPRAELRYRCAPHAPTHVGRPTWLCLAAQNWLCLLARCQEKADAAVFRQNAASSRLPVSPYWRPR